MAGKKISTYKYYVNMKYINGNKQIELDSKTIRTIQIEYDYERNNLPIIYVSMNLVVDDYNTMVLNSKTGKMLLDIKISDDKKSNAIKKSYIKDQFSYFFTTDRVENDEDLIKEADSGDKSYKRVVVALLKSELVDNNKRMINNIFKNTNTSSIVHYYTHHMKMIIEPFDNNPSHKLFIIPPIEGISKLLRFINESSSFYKTAYRYFMDFNTTYLLSSTGKGIDIKDGTYPTIKIDIKNVTNEKNIEKRGIYKDVDNKIYIIEINANDSYIVKNNITEKKFNKLVGVDSLGNTSSYKLNINNEKDSSTKTKMVRVYNDNLNYLNTLANGIESTSSIITVVKGDIDSSLIVPYKEYHISNIKQYKNLNDKYLLVYKKEIIVKDDDAFSCSTSMSFKRVS